MTGIQSVNGAMPGPGFEDIQQDILAEAQALGVAIPAGQERLSLNQEYALFRVAAQGVLSVLGSAGVEDASILSNDLAEAAEHDPLTDVYSVAVGYSYDLDVADDPISQGAQNRRARLAYVTGKTAQAAMAVALGKPRALDSLRKAREEILEHERPARSLAGYSLHALLDRAEDVPLGTQEDPQNPAEPLAA